MLIAVDEEVLDGFEIERKWRNHINNSNMLAMHKEKQALKEKLDIAVNRFLVIKNQIELWKTGYYGKMENCVEYYIEKTVDEALAKIKEIEE